MSPRRRPGDAAARTRQRAEQARRAAEAGARAAAPEAERKAEAAAEAARRLAGEAASDAADRPLVEAAHAAIREQKPMLEAMAAAAQDLESRRARAVDPIVRPLWERCAPGRDALAAAADLFEIPSMQDVAGEAETRGFATISIAAAGGAAWYGGGAGSLGIAGGVGLGILPVRAGASAALFGSIGLVGGAAWGASAGLQLGVWLRSPRELGQPLEETFLALARAEGCARAVLGTLDTFDPLHPAPAGSFKGLEAGADVGFGGGAGIYFDVGLLGKVQGTTVSVNCGGSLSANLQYGKVVTYELGAIGAV